MKKYLILGLSLVSIVVYAATSYTTHYDLAKPADGDSNWGGSYRDNMDTIDGQMFINATSISEHVADTVGAHAATAISTSVGPQTCTIADDVQEFLDCLDSQIGSIVGGTVVTTNTDQTITGTKTFSTTPILSALSAGILHVGSGGVLTSSAIVNADVDAAAAIAYSKLNLTGSILNADINASAAIADTKLATISTAGKVSNSATTATSANTASAIVARDGSGNFTAGTITAALSGNASTATALAANPTDCGANTFATTIAANGDLTCSAVDLSSDVSSSVLPLANGGTGKALTASNGSVVYSDADSLELLADGSDGQCLRTDGAGNLSWGTCGGRNITGSTASPTEIAAGTPYTPVGDDEVLFVDTASGEVTVTANPRIEDTNNAVGDVLTIMGTSDANYPCYATGNGIILNGQFCAYQYNSIQLMYDGTNWVELTRSVP